MVNFRKMERIRGKGALSFPGASDEISVSDPSHFVVDPDPDPGIHI